VRRTGADHRPVRPAVIPSPPATTGPSIPGSTMVVARPEVPAVGAVPRIEEAADTRLGGWLRAVAVRRASVPLVEVRLAVPLGAPLLARRAELAVLDETFSAGTARLDRSTLSSTLQSLGGHLTLDVSVDRVVLRAGSLATHLGELLSLVAELLQHAAYADDAVHADRRRMADEVMLLRSDPAVVAGELLDRRLYRRHPYRHRWPTPSAVRRVQPDALRTLHQAALVRRAGALVIVGDVTPDTVLGQAEEALGPWLAAAGAAGAPEPVEPVDPPAPGPLMLMPRSGALQSNIRLAGAAPGRRDEQAPAAALANLCFGGLFGSRLVENLRERRGYTYSPRSAIDHRLAGSRLVVTLDVATEVTAPALVEVAYELGRAVTTGFSAQEVDDARRYALGSLTLATATQDGLAEQLAAWILDGLGPDHLQHYGQSLQRCEPDEVAAAARRLLAPAGIVTTVVGDATATEASLATLGALQVLPDR